jgi:hypothetical protein
VIILKENIPRTQHSSSIAAKFNNDHKFQKFAWRKCTSTERKLKRGITPQLLPLQFGLVVVCLNFKLAA